MNEIRIYCLADLTILNMYRDDDFDYSQNHIIWDYREMNESELLTLINLHSQVEYLTIKVERCSLETWLYFADQCRSLRQLNITVKELETEAHLGIIANNPQLKVFSLDKIPPTPRIPIRANLEQHRHRPWWRPKIRLWHRH